MTLSGWLGYHRCAFPAVFQREQPLLDVVGRSCSQDPAVPFRVQYQLQISSEGQNSSAPATCILSSDLFSRIFLTNAFLRKISHVF